MSVTTVRTIQALRDQVKAWRKDDLLVGVVPTMGALHAGHLSLVEAALSTCERVVVTLFVNPTQFGEGEDFSVYPRDEDRDRSLIEERGAHVLFAPKVEEMYPPGCITEVHLPGPDRILEGLHRPGHFTGVATVVTKLLNQAQADHAFFGEKDFQQLMVIKTLARDLCIPTQIHGVETVREDDGLALSSRNMYLNVGERETAPILNQTLRQVAADYRAGGDGAALCRAAAKTLKDAGFGPVDYVAIADSVTFAEQKTYDPAHPARILAAAKLGRARLIDNIAVDD
ncbi:pantoate--beta-alanine ligase [Magnetovibrio sp. PR-2]|uniref:pantoate--beta-alanine ligase n=1 Tax=Magnetovibrio sp. PR-2 TaxID=3120356 RepID=UPI002FCE0D9A